MSTPNSDTNLTGPIDPANSSKPSGTEMTFIPAPPVTGSLFGGNEIRTVSMVVTTEDGTVTTLPLDYRFNAWWLPVAGPEGPVWPVGE